MGLALDKLENNREHKHSLMPATSTMKNARTMSLSCLRARGGE